MCGVSFTVMGSNRASRYVYKQLHHQPNRRLFRHILQHLLGVIVISTVSIACTNRLRDYVQLDVQVIPVSGTSAAAPTTEITEETLLQTTGILEKRLAEQGIELAEIESEAPDQITIRLPQATNLAAATENLLQRGLLRLQPQKTETEEDLANNIAALQRLLVEQNTLRQTNKPAEANVLQPDIDKTRADILALFEPSDLSGDMLLDAQAVQITGFNTWEIKIWFNTQGANQFTQQTKEIAGTGRAIGIFLDDVLLSTPIVPIEYAETGIPGGEAVISGNFTREAAKDLEVQLRGGALPVELELLSVSSSEDPETPDPETPAADESTETEDPEAPDSTTEEEDTANPE